MKKRGQGSVEFTVIASIMFVVFIGLFFVIQKSMVGVGEARIYNVLEGLANLVSTEVRLADSAQGEYSREFLLPEVISGYNYDINIYNKTEIVISIEDSTYVVFLDENVSGEISKGRNVIKKSDDNISISSVG